MPRPPVLFLLVGVLSASSGCATLADARAAKGTGLARIYSASREAVWKAVPDVLSDLKLTLVKEDSAEGCFLAENGWSGFSYGERVAVFVDAMNGEPRTRVEVVSKRVLATTVFGPDWQLPILDKLDEKLRFDGTSPAAPIPGS